MNGNKHRIFLLHKPEGVVDKDIYLSAQSGSFQVESYQIKVARTIEGHTVEQLELLDVAKRMISFKPDFVLTVNGAGLDNDGFFAYLCSYMQLPLVIWYVDEPFVVPEWGRKFIPETTVGFTFDRFYEKRLREWGIPWVYTLPLGANAERMLGYARSGSDKENHSNSVSFVGSLDYAKIEYLMENISATWTDIAPCVIDVLEEAIYQYRLNPRRETEEIVRDCAERLACEFKFPDGIVKQMVLSFVDREASFRLRYETVEALKPFGIAVYGEEFWEKVVGREFYKGRIGYYSDQIARLYKSSKINLNISKYQLKTTVNQRVFDCALCDGFLITDFKEDIEQYFEIDKSIVVFFDLDDLKNKVAFYLENESKAREIVEKGKETILNRHTYEHRLREMSCTVERIRREGRFEKLCSKALEANAPRNFEPFVRALFEDGHPQKTSFEKQPTCDRGSHGDEG